MTNLEKKFLEKLYSQDYDSKSQEETVDFFFYVFENQKKQTERLYGKLPGGFSQRVFDSFISGKRDFSKHFSFMSRIDFEVESPTCVFLQF